MEPGETEQFDLYEGLDNFEDSSEEREEAEETGEAPDFKSGPEEEEGDDDLNLVVDDEAAAPAPEAQEQKALRKSTRSHVYSRKDRNFFIGAPAAAELSEAPMGNIELFVVLSNLPLWLDNLGLRSYVEGVGAGVLFCKVLYNFYSGAPLGLGFLEFADISQCTAFLSHQSQIAATPMPQGAFAQLQACRDYRLGLVSESFAKSVCRHFSVPYSRAGLNSLSQLDLIEIEFERQQEELARNGEFAMVAKTFPWFNFDLVSMMGNCARLLGRASEGASHFQSYSSLGAGSDADRGQGLPSPQVLSAIGKDDPNVERLIDRKSPHSEGGKSKKAGSGEARARSPESRSKKRARSHERSRTGHSGKDKEKDKDREREKRSKRRDRSRDRSRERSKGSRHRSPQRSGHHKSSHRR